MAFLYISKQCLNIKTNDKDDKTSVWVQKISSIVLKLFYFVDIKNNLHIAWPRNKKKNIIFLFDTVFNFNN